MDEDFSRLLAKTAADFFTEEEVPLNNLIGVRALHLERSKVATVLHLKLGAKDPSRTHKFDQYAGDPNPSTLFGDYESIAEVHLLRHKLDREHSEASQREQGRQSRGKKNSAPKSAGLSAALKYSKRKAYERTKLWQ
jgi:hypothetical protein